MVQPIDYSPDFVIQNGGGFFALPDNLVNQIANVNGGGSGVLTPTPSPIVGANKPTQQFDISVLAGLRPTDKYLGRNLVRDIEEAYATYISGSPVGRGGQYAVDAARRYGTTITEAARGYLQATGLPTLVQEFFGLPNSEVKTPFLEFEPDEKDFFGLPVPDTQVTTTVTDGIKDQFRVLTDAITKLFGGAVYNPPLQSQATGYTPITTSQPLGSGGSGFNVGGLLILGVIGVIGYFVYKRFAS